MSHVSKNISARDRVKQFGDAFHADNNVLFCSLCNKTIDHIRLQTIKDHVGSKRHQEQLSHTSSDSSNKRQKTIDGSFKQISAAKTSRDVLINDWVEMCSTSNILLEKSDHPAVKNFLKSYFGT